MSVIKRFFQIASPPTVFIQFLCNLAHMFYCQYAEIFGTDFRNIAFKIVGKFFKFYFWTFTSVSAAAELSRPMARPHLHQSMEA